MPARSQGEREAAFRILYDRTRVQLIAYALRRTRNAEDAADVVAEVFLIAWKRFESVPEDEKSLLWLYVTARRVMANRVRRTETRSKVMGRLRFEFTAYGADGHSHEAMLVARDLLNQLSDGDREILMLAGWEGLGSTELAAVLGCSVTAARIRLHRARSHLRKAVAELEGDATISTEDGTVDESVPTVEEA
jgi:RNA polymerase sigma factor (sigma-70 family)